LHIDNHKCNLKWSHRISDIKFMTSLSFLRLVTMQKHIYMVQDVLRFEYTVLLRREIISLQTISNVLNLSQLQNSIKPSRVHLHTHKHTYIHIYPIQINQPTRCNSFTSLLLDVYV